MVPREWAGNRRDRLFTMLQRDNEYIAAPVSNAVERITLESAGKPQETTKYKYYIALKDTQELFSDSGKTKEKI
jgi:hypothetical protein